jgi:hypothetical protein
MTEIEKIDLFKKIEDGIVEHKLNLKDACEKAGISYMDFYNHVRSMDEDKFSQLFARAREVRGLEILDDCLAAFKKMQDDDDPKVQWKQKNIIDQGLKLAGKLNQALSDKISNQTNIQVNNYQDQFVLKQVENGK